jgi:hypothetical protein
MTKTNEKDKIKGKTRQKTKSKALADDLARKSLKATAAGLGKKKGSDEG